MDTLKEQVIGEIRRRKFGKECEDLCKKIFEWYDNGGSRNLKEQVKKLMKTTTKSFEQERDSAKIASKLKKVPKKKKTKRQRK